MTLLKQMVTNEGVTVDAMSERQPVMLVFLRHFGCTFCREALADLSAKREEIAALHTQLVLVHMTDNRIAEKYFSRFRLTGVTHVSDPLCQFYQGLGLVKGNFNQLFGLRNWIEGFQAGVLDGHGIGLQLGDGFQMPGVFMIREGQIIESFIHEIAADRPDYLALVSRCCTLDATVKKIE